MSTLYLRSRMEERAALADLATSVLDKCAADAKEPTPEQRQQLDAWGTKVKSLDSEIAQLETVVNGNAKFAQIAGRLSDVEEREERRDADRRERVEVRERPKSAGEQFVESDAFKNYNGGSSPKVEFGGFLEERAAITTADLAIPAHVFTPATPSFTSPLLNVVGREVVSSGNVEYIVWGPASEAAVVPEGELKPEATLVPTAANDALETIAHWKAISRQALEDSPRIQSIVEGSLRQGLALKLESLAASVLNAETGFTPVAAEDLYKGIRVAVGEVQADGFQPNAVLLNPSDYADLDINTAADANNGPIAFASYWGVQPIPVASVASGTAYVGDFKDALTWFDRNKSAVFLTDSHADYFLRNLLVVLAETRAKFAVTNPAAAAKITVAPAGGAAASRSTK